MPNPSKTDDELNQVQEAFFWEFTSMITRFVDWLHNYERIETLTRNQAEFLNSMALARQIYLDGEDMTRKLTNAEKEELK